MKANEKRKKQAEINLNILKDKSKLNWFYVYWIISDEKSKNILKNKSSKMFIY